MFTWLTDDTKNAKLFGPYLAHSEIKAAIFKRGLHDRVWRLRIGYEHHPASDVVLPHCKTLDTAQEMSERILLAMFPTEFWPDEAAEALPVVKVDFDKYFDWSANR